LGFGVIQIVIPFGLIIWMPYEWIIANAEKYCVYSFFTMFVSIFISIIWCLHLVNKRSKK